MKNKTELKYEDLEFVAGGWDPDQLETVDRARYDGLMNNYYRAEASGNRDLVERAFAELDRFDMMMRRKYN